MRETWVRSLGWEDPLEKEKATHSSTLARNIPWTEKPGRLQSIESQESDTTERLFTFHFHTVGDDQPVIGPKRSSKAFPKAKLVPEKKAVVTVWWCAAGLIQYSFLNPGETITSDKYFHQVDEMYWKLQHRSQHLSTEKPNSSPLLCQTACHTTSISKVEQIGPQSFASSTIFTWPLANGLPLLQASGQLFSGKMLPWAAGDRKWFPRVCQILKQGFLQYRNKQTFLAGKNVLVVLAPILINKDVFGSLIMI